MIDISLLSDTYTVRILNENDIPDIVSLCLDHPLFYEYTSVRPTAGQVRTDMTALPPGKTEADKYYAGFFDDDGLIAVIDLIDGYPDSDTAFIGFFMVRKDLEGKGIGSSLINEVTRTLSEAGFCRIRLCINEGNPQSGHFWEKQGFRLLERYIRDDGSVWLAEKTIGQN
ncbi:MAG: GNAT family N-acetyltransferase [Solobacterium sp.]|nr:GNAT family N-acetyltransferase [Solobacterium sp.]